MRFCLFSPHPLLQDDEPGGLTVAGSDTPPLQNDRLLQREAVMDQIARGTSTNDDACAASMRMQNGDRIENEPDFAGSPAQHPDDVPIDEVAWNVLQASSCRDDFRRYLRQFQASKHRCAAIERVISLEDNPNEGVTHYPEVITFLISEARSGKPSAQFHLGKAFRNKSR